ncbi:hypothetical protein [Nitrogeniibacter aestuarii]|uniref:hypothetical protein n=1 Tax=Nitrogeniibacter aestuarii TaxID=2815343 RepID=UPI001D1105CB|nr:hypothetical protein [Nitrogeniibacter aestuarii]
MKTQKMLGKLRALLRGPLEDTPRKKICKAIKALKARQRELEARLMQTEGKRARQRLEQKIHVIRAQRLKGQQRYREIKTG